MRKKIGRDYQIKELIPTIISLIVLVILIVLLVLVINLKANELVEEIDTTDYAKDSEVITEDKLELTEQCAIDAQDAANDIQIFYDMEGRSGGINNSEDELNDDGTYGSSDYTTMTYIPSFTIVGLSENMTVSVTDSDGTQMEVEMIDTNGAMYKFDGYDSKVIEEYKVVFYTEGCSQAIKQFTIKAPIFNEYSDTTACLQYPEFEWCKPYIYTNDYPSWKEFGELLNQYKADLVNGKITTSTTSNLEDPDYNKGFSMTDEDLSYLKTTENNTTKTNSESTKSKKNIMKYIIIGASAVLLIILIITISIIVKKRRNRL